MRIVFLALLMGSTVLGEAAQRLRVIVINDGANSHKRGADLSIGCDGNQSGWEQFLGNAFVSEPDRLTIDLIEGDDVSPTHIRTFLQQIIVAPGDNIFLYYCGHGGWDRAQGHFFMLGLEGNMLRSEVRDLLMQKRARGVFLITDSCTSFADFSFFPQAPEPRFALFYDLFLVAQGLVDISSSSMGQESWFTKMGSVFSNEFSMAVAGDREGYDLNGDGLVSWAEFFPKLRESMQQSFLQLKAATPAGSSMRKASGQTPAFYFLAEWPQYQKRLWAQNSTGETVRLTLHYLALSADTHTWQWLPGEPGTAAGLVYDLLKQTTTPLLSQSGIGLVAARVRWTAVGVDSGRSYGSGDALTAPPGGYSVVVDPSSVNFVIPISIR